MKKPPGEADLGRHFASPLHFRVCAEGHEILFIKSHSITGKTHGAFNRVLFPPECPLDISHFREFFFFKKMIFPLDLENALQYTSSVISLIHSLLRRRKEYGRKEASHEVPDCGPFCWQI